MPLLRAALLALLSLPAMAFAQGVQLGGAFAADPSAPVEVTSDSLSVDQATGAATFTGNVSIGQGDLRVQAGTVEVRYDEATGGIARLLASGGVRIEAERGIVVEAPKMTADLDTGTLEAEAVTAATPWGSIEAGALTLAQGEGKGARLVFNRGVRLLYLPERPPPAEAP